MRSESKRVHAFMEKFMEFKLLMRRTRKKDNHPRFLLVILHSINHGEPIMVSQLSQKMEMTNAAATQMVDTLAKHKWVKRTQDENDRRVFWVVLTEQGKAVLKEVFDEATMFMEGMIQYIGMDNFEHLDHTLDKVMQYTRESGFLKP